MKVIFVDYSESFYLTGTSSNSADKVTGKFVQVKNDAIEYLIFSPKELTPYHADIVQRFCSEMGIYGVYVDASKRFDIHNPGWIVIGGGRFEIDKERENIRLYDNSMAYGKFDTKGLKEKICSIDKFKDFSLEIE